MALTYVGGTSGGGTGASYTVSLNATLTGGSNSSPSAGDLILVFTGEANGASVTSTCSGNTAGAYSTIRAHQNQADSHDANLDSFYKFAGATPDTTLTITRGANNTTYGSSTVVHVWRGAATATPFNVTPTIAASANGSAANPAAITPTVAGSVVLYCGHASQLAASGTAFTTAGTYPISRKTDGSTGDSIVMASHYTAWTSGAYDPAAFAGSTTATTLGWVALTIVIAPEVRSLTCSSGSYTYTGTSATLMRNRVAVPSAGAYTYTGSSATLTKGAALVNRELTANAGSYTYTGSTAALVKGKRLVTTAGSYTYTGSTAVLLRNRALVSNAGSYTYTGQSATLSRGRPLIASSGSYTYTGQNATLSRGRPLTASVGSYALTGSDATITKAAALNNRDLTAQAGSYTYTGSSASLLLGRALTASAGSYTYAGQSATLSRGRPLTAVAGEYTYTGQSAAILRGRVIESSAGSYDYTGQSADITYEGTGYSLIAEPGAYAITGQIATISKGRAILADPGWYVYTGSSAALSVERVAVITPGQVRMLTDIWQRFGLDPAAPLTETETAASFAGIVLAKSGTSAITSTRSGPGSVGNTDLMLRDIWRRLGLDADTPMTAAADIITAGWLEQTITPTAGGVIVTRIDPPYTATPGYFAPGYLENQE
jgi:hypothetical protein